MVAGVVQDCLSLLNGYPEVAREASIRAQSGYDLDSLRFGVQTGEISLRQLLLLPVSERKNIAEQGPIIDWYLGDTRAYKRTTRTLLFAFCPDVDRHIVPLHGRFVIQLPQGFSNVLAVKLAVLYMEQYLLNSRVRSAPWKAEDDLVTYVYLAELFAFIGMLGASRDVEEAIFRRFRESLCKLSRSAQSGVATIIPFHQDMQKEWQTTSSPLCVSRRYTFWLSNTTLNRTRPTRRQ